MKKAVLSLLLLTPFVSLAATNDVSQCWAATQSGNRCKRRAAVGMRYCRQHAASHEPKTAPDRCRSMTTNGVRCAEAPLPKRNYCQKHMDAQAPRP